MAESRHILATKSEANVTNVVVVVQPDINSFFNYFVSITVDLMCTKVFSKMFLCPSLMECTVTDDLSAKRYGKCF